MGPPARPRRRDASGRSWASWRSTRSSRWSARRSRAADAARAGHASLDELFAELDERGDAQIWRIELHWAGEDPRRALREQADLDGAELERLRDRLGRLDRASRHGPWTRQTLELIARQPEVRAADLAASIGREKLPFKRDVRKLKELGLTESLLVGYRLSPRGRALLESLGADGAPRP